MWFDDTRLFRQMDPWREVRRLQHDIGQVLEGNLGSLLGGGYPPMNVFRNDEGLTVDVEVPGVSPEDLDVNVHRRTLTVKGQRATQEPAENELFHRRERGTGSFVRTVELPYDVDADKVSASYRYGILRLELPRAEADKPRKITVKGA
jgi:HSP20 family protein